MEAAISSVLSMGRRELQDLALTVTELLNDDRVQADAGGCADGGFPAPSSGLKQSAVDPGQVRTVVKRRQDPGLIHGEREAAAFGLG